MVALNIPESPIAPPQNQSPEAEDPATTSSNHDHAFPPCTAERCHVDEEEKKKAGVNRPRCEMAEKCVDACAAYGRVCPCAARIAAHAACDAMQELQKDSQMFEGKPPFLYLNADDLQIGKKLGEGGFSNVNECIVTTPNHPDTGRELAIKYLKRKAMVDLHHFKHGAADLCVEAYFLQTLNHPNIIKLHGITAGSVETNVATGKECGFFIVVDRLYDTLEHKVEEWKKQNAQAPQPGSFRPGKEFKESKRAQLEERCDIALKVAKAMEYLHSRNVIFRDLKPDNIGFDQDGVLKLFDFGLAKELKHKQADGTYKLTGHTGSRRYMAPEVALDEPYNEKVDVFSFAIMLWEMCAAMKPFFGYSSNKHMQLVVHGGERPRMDSSVVQGWPPALQNLLKRCWCRNPDQRPSFTQIIAVLENKILHKSNTNSKCLEHQGSLGLEEAVDELTNNGDRSSTEDKPGFFGRIVKPIMGGRAVSVDAAAKPAPGSFRHLKPQRGLSDRARSWGFSNGKKSDA